MQKWDRERRRAARGERQAAAAFSVDKFWRFRCRRRADGREERLEAGDAGRSTHDRFFFGFSSFLFLRALERERRRERNSLFLSLSRPFPSHLHTPPLSLSLSISPPPSQREREREQSCLLFEATQREREKRGGGRKRKTHPATTVTLTDISPTSAGYINLTNSLRFINMLTERSMWCRWSARTALSTRSVVIDSLRFQRKLSSFNRNTCSQSSGPVRPEFESRHGSLFFFASLSLPVTLQRE